MRAAITWLPALAALARAAITRLLALAALAALAGPAAAQDAGAPPAAEPEGWAYELAGELMSPFCPGRTLADCPSDAAKSLVMWMVVQEAAGRTREDVREELLARYGEVMRPQPKAEGIGLTAYLIPAAVFAGGGVLVGYFLHRQTRRARAEAPAPADVERDPELERRLDEELAR